MGWTKEQQFAIDEEGKNIIVSAGAGSGKTAVLTARVLRKLQSGVHINQLLILTFTNAAAAEMKQRIRSQIAKTEGLEEELNLIDSAYITTFDSFSLAMVKKYHTKLNVTNNIKITDEVVIDIEKNRILDQIMEENYLSYKPEFVKLISDFCLKDDRELKNYILNIYKKIELKYDKEKYLANYLEEFYSEKKVHTFVDEFFNLIKGYQKEVYSLVERLNDYFDGDYVVKVEEVLSKLLNADSYEEIKNSLEIKLPIVPRGSSDEGKKIKANIGDLLKQIKNLVIYESVDDAVEEIQETIYSAKIIVDIICELDKRLTLYKKENNAYNFNDIARMAIKVVDLNSDVRDELINSFNEILVDEYQDTSDTQEKFISLISNNNVYMVGDIKQSIYRFRNANPYIFKEKYDTYRDTDLGVKIDLVKNFRSRKEVLDNINLLFNLFMDDKLGGADYRESHQMVFGNNTYLEEGFTEQNYNLDVLTYSEVSRKFSKDEHEAFLIGNDIINKISSRFQVFDKDKKVLRDIKYSDFVILLDKSKSFDLYKKIFEYLHIPLTILKDESLKKDQDILVIKNLLKLLVLIKENNHTEDLKYCYLSVARSFIYKMDDSTIYEYLVNNTYKDSPLYLKCEKLIDKIDNSSLSDFFNYVLDEFNYDEKLLSVGNVKSFRIRAEYLYNLIRSFEQQGNTVYDFISYLDEIFESGYDLKFSTNTVDNDSCKIMTIHKSKGLEFPVCYFAGFSNRFNMSELKEKIIFDNKYGIIIPKVLGSYKDTILKLLLKESNKREEISEKIRLLYVALTRAKEKMIIVIPEIEETGEVFALVSDLERCKYNSFLSIIKSIYSALLPFVVKTEVSLTKKYLDNNVDSVKYQDEAQKIEVSELCVESSLLEEKHYSKESLHVASLEEMKLMELGTKAHLILEQIDFSLGGNFESDIPNEVLDKIKLFLNSDIIKKNKNAKFYKEYEFVQTRGAEVSHGIIDLLIETDDKMIIVDYKLKNIDDVLYDKQLNGYREYIYNKTNKPTECYLFSILDGVFRKVEI